MRLTVKTIIIFPSRANTGKTAGNNQNNNAVIIIQIITIGIKIKSPPITKLTFQMSLSY